MPNRVKILKDKFTQSWGLPFLKLLPESTIQSIIEELKIKYRRLILDPHESRLRDWRRNYFKIWLGSESPFKSS